MPEEWLRLEAIEKDYGSVRALRGIDLGFRAGEVHALIGENGCGKSTTVKILSGAIRPDRGRIVIDDREMWFTSPADALRQQIGTTYQDSATVPQLSVAENIALGREERFAGWLRRTEVARAREVLASMHVDLDPHAPVASLTPAERQLTAIAKAVAAKARLLILDEPTAALWDVEVRLLFALIAQLRADGMSILYISHRLGEIEKLADRVTILRDGAHVTTVEAGTLTRDELISAMIGRDLGSEFPAKGGAQRDVVLAASALTSPLESLDVERLEVRGGEIVGIAGLDGSGRHALAQTLAGVEPLTSGTVTIDGEPLERRSRRVGYVPQDRRSEAVFPQFDVGKSLTVGSLWRYRVGGLVSPKKERLHAEESRTRLHVKAPSLASPISTLSGGNQQKVVLGRALMRVPRVLVCEEPTAGVDVGARREIYEVLRAAAGNGVAIVIGSTDGAELIGLCDRVVVMRAGRMHATLEAESLTEEALTAAVIPQESAVTHHSLSFQVDRNSIPNTETEGSAS